MCIDREMLAFPVRVEFEEIDYRIVYAEPQPITMKVLENSSDALYIFAFFARWIVKTEGIHISSQKS